MEQHREAQIREMVDSWRFPEPVYVTRPNLPRLDAFTHALEPAWEKQWITNGGCLHERLESELSRVLDTPCLSLFCNGTIALMVALKALNLAPGTVITSPFTFPATVNALHWCSLRPVFCDIIPDTCNINPEQIESRITADTRAIMPVHVYGVPCDVERIQEIADRHGLPVIYDAAHAFGVRYKGKSILAYGDVSMLSFHATKVFTTAEGGALATADPEIHHAVQLWKNFGIADEETVMLPGINGKMSELQAALGLTQIETIEERTQQRARVALTYRSLLNNEPGITLFEQLPDTEHNYAYFPVRVQGEAYGLDRNALYSTLKACNIHCRKYFYPLCSTYSWCRADEGALPQAEAAASEILCLPIYAGLPANVAETICKIIAQVGAIAR